MTSIPGTPAGWYPDPAGGPQSRWWDGAAWTDHLQQPYDPASAAQTLRAPEGTKAYTAWIWLVVFLPYLTLPLLFTLNFSSMFAGIDPRDPSSTNRAQLEMMTSPAYLALSLGGFVLAAAVVVCSYLDWRALVARGVPKPFHWAWSFFSLAGYPVYAIGRAVVTRRRTGQGFAVLWAVIGMFVFAIIVGIVWAGTIFVQVMQQVSTYSGSVGS